MSFPLSRVLVLSLSLSLSCSLLSLPLLAEAKPTTRQTSRQAAAKQAAAKTATVKQTQEKAEPEYVSTPAKLVSLRVDPKSGNLVFQTDGGSLHPVLSMESLNNMTRLTLKAETALLDTDFKIDSAQLLSELQKVDPAIKSIALEPMSAKGFKVLIDSEKSFRALVMNNTGSLVTLNLHAPDPLAAKLASAKVATASSSKAASSNLSKPVSTKETEVVSGCSVNALISQPAAQPNFLEQLASPETDGVVRSAWEDLQRGNLPNTILNLKSYLDKIKDDQLARFVLAQAFLASQDYIGAEKELKGLLAINADHLPATLMLLNTQLQTAQMNSNRLREAETLLNSALAKWPNHPQVLYHRALIYERQGQSDLAKSAYQKTLAEDALNTEAMSRLAEMELKTGSPYTALSYYQRVLGINPKDTDAKVQLANLYLQLNDNEQATRWMQDSFSPTSLIGYAKLQVKKNQPEVALQWLGLAESVLTKQSNPDLVSLFDMGMLYASLKESASAKKNLQQFLDWSVKPGVQPKQNPLDEKRIQDAQKTLKGLMNQPASKQTASSSVTTKPAASANTNGAAKSTPQAGTPQAKDTAIKTPAASAETIQQEPTSNPHCDSCGENYP